jgi:arylsulfatase
MRRGRWKIVSHAPAYAWSLFDMKTDPTELRDVAVEYPKVTQQMAADYEVWADEVGVVKRGE